METESMESEKYFGEVIWFNPKKGYGYIKQAMAEKDIFVHWKNIVCDGFKTLYPGQQVEYVIGANHRGEQAEMVIIMQESEQE